MDIGEAVKELKKGNLVARKGWNGKGLFIFMQVPSRISVENIVPKMQSLPDKVKEEFKLRLDRTTLDVGNNSVHNHSTIDYSNQLAMVYPDNCIYGWVASPSDVLATDWEIYNG